LSALRKLLDLAHDIRSLANRGGGGDFSSGYGDIGCQCFGRRNIGGGSRGRVHIGGDIGNLGGDLHGRGIDSGNRSLGADLGNLRRSDDDTRSLGADLGDLRRGDGDTRSLGADLGDLGRDESDGGNLNGRVYRIGVERVAVESRRQILSPVTHLEDFWRGSDTEVSVVETVCW
jgi:hypothetical protein